MSDNLFNRYGSDTFEMRHGRGVLKLRGGQPDEAKGCLLPNGEVTDALCLAAHGDEQVWTRKISTTNHLHRRGRLFIEPGVALRFVDESDADVSVGQVIARPSLERDLLGSHRIQICARSKVFALLLYLALQSVDWRHDETDEVWSCSWGQSGDIVDRLHDDSGVAMWHQLVYEQALPFTHLDEAVVAEIAALGWTPILDKGATL
jgi:hypothetical protein